jgi:hypothetical protein
MFVKHYLSLLSVYDASAREQRNAFFGTEELGVTQKKASVKTEGKGGQLRAVQDWGEGTPLEDTELKDTEIEHRTHDAATLEHRTHEAAAK